MDGDDDISERVYNGIRKWLETIEFELDEHLGHLHSVANVHTVATATYSSCSYYINIPRVFYYI